MVDLKIYNRFFLRLECNRIQNNWVHFLFWYWLSKNCIGFLILCSKCYINTFYDWFMIMYRRTPQFCNLFWVGLSRHLPKSLSTLSTLKKSLAIQPIIREVEIDVYLNVNVWMWRHGHMLEADLKSFIFRFVSNSWTSVWTHDVILHRNWWCHAF